MTTPNPAGVPVADGAEEAVSTPPGAAASSGSPFVTIRSEVSEAGFTDEEYVVVDASKVIGVVGRTNDKRRRQGVEPETRIVFAGGADVTVRAPLDQVVEIIRIGAAR